MLFERHFASSLGRFRLSATSSKRGVKARSMPVHIETLLASHSDTLRDDQAARLRRYFLTVTPELAEARKQIDALRRRMPEFPTTLVMREGPADNPRPTFRHHRGEYLSPREKATPAVPEFLPSLPPKAPANRLTLARWLVSDRNPLVGRVTVNRNWQALFGRNMFIRSGDYNPKNKEEWTILNVASFVCEPDRARAASSRSPAISSGARAPASWIELMMAISTKSRPAARNFAAACFKSSGLAVDISR